MGLHTQTDQQTTNREDKAVVVYLYIITYKDWHIHVMYVYLFNILYSFIHSPVYGLIPLKVEIY